MPPREKSVIFTRLDNYIIVKFRRSVKLLFLLEIMQIIRYNDNKINSEELLENWALAEKKQELFTIEPMK